MTSAQETVINALAPVLQRHFGAQATVAEARRLTAGASAATWQLRVTAGAQHSALILRLEAGGEAFGSGVGKTLEARTQQAAFSAGVPVAEVLEIFDQHPQLGNGYLMTCLPGESIARRILRDDHYQLARDQLAGQCAAALATIHAIDRQHLPELPLQDAVTQLDQLQSIHRSFAERLPVFELAFRWLRDHAPTLPAATLVHGDFRLGNFLVDESGLTGVLDWELTHLGDPMEDLGWLCVNAWRFGSDLPVGGFASREQFYQLYARQSGRPVDPQRVRYWEIFGNLKWGVICQFQAYTHLKGEVRSAERAAIGRRVAETEWDILQLMKTPT